MLSNLYFSFLVTFTSFLALQLNLQVFPIISSARSLVSTFSSFRSTNVIFVHATRVYDLSYYLIYDNLELES